MMSENLENIASRFRNFLPVVIDLETTGFDAKTNAIIQIAIIILGFDSKGKRYYSEYRSSH